MQDPAITLQSRIIMLFNPTIIPGFLSFVLSIPLSIADRNSSLNRAAPEEDSHCSGQSQRGKVDKFRKQCDVHCAGSRQLLANTCHAVQLNVSYSSDIPLTSQFCTYHDR